jgi:antitoxin component YwqK of YwqJK toxin-antitoxin module
MKQKLILIFLMILFCSNSFGQKLTLSDLTNLCNKKNWQDVNQTLLLKGWTYYNSEKGDTEKYSTITWSYNKEEYSDKAQAWFYLFTFENYPNKISYSVFNKTGYLLIQNSLAANGFKLISSEIEDEKVISTYSNLGYTLQISNAKRKDDDWSERSLTAYVITLIKKAGIYDSQNGKKIDYFANGDIEAEYTLLNGKMNGQLKTYDSIGNLKKVGNYINSKANGKFIEYENGEKNAEYLMTNDNKNGLLTFYENSNISYTTNFKNDSKNGQHINYYYDDNKKLFLKEYGQYINDEANGTWNMFYVLGKTEKKLEYCNYLKNLKEGIFQKVKGDSLIIGNYKADELNGNYKIYIDKNRSLNDGFINSDISKLTLITDGQYLEGKMKGYWKNYGPYTGLLKDEGNYLNDSKTGEWKYYYTKSIKEEGKPEKHQRELYETANFSEGNLNGKRTKYFYRDNIKYPCDELDENGIKLDSCTEFVYHKILEVWNYKDGELNGLYEWRDSSGKIVNKGNFLKDLKDGEWLISDGIETDNTYQKGKFIADKHEGKWITYYKNNQIAVESNFKNDKLNGEFIEYNNYNKPKYFKKFENDELKELIVYDSIGVAKIKKYEIYENSNDYFRCRKTNYRLDNSMSSQEYWIKKVNDIEHNLFEEDFYLKTNNESDGNSGYKDGNYTFIDKNGKLSISGYFLKENKINKWTYYFYEQNIKIESNYVNGEINDELFLKINGELFSGEFIQNNDDKKLKIVSEIKNGLRNGKTSYLDLNTNKTIKKQNYKNGILKE